MSSDNPGNGIVDFLSIAASEQDSGPFLCEDLGGFEADAGIRTADKNRLSGLVEQLCGCPRQYRIPVYRRKIRRILILLAAIALLAAAFGDATNSESAAIQAPTEAATTAPPTTVAAPDVGSTAGTASTSDGAELVLVSATEIEDALSGNTAIGNWLGEQYVQYFDPSGNTTYVPDSGQPSVGGWRVNVASGQYESLWAPARVWDTYDVFRDGDDWFWTGGGVELSPFTIVEGNQLP